MNDFSTEKGHVSAMGKAEVRAVGLRDTGTVPNNPRLPLLLYKQAVEWRADAGAELFEERFAVNGWPPAWRDGLFDFHHYHSTAHEALGIYAGHAVALLGGKNGLQVTLEPGDVVIIPAGVGHKCLERSDDLAMVGAYPDGTGPDLLRGEAHERPACIESIARVSIPPRDPLYGVGGPMLDHWRP